MEAKVKWGIIGLGGIAHKFAQALEVIPEAELVAVASRSKENAEAFGNEYNVLTRYDSYDDLVIDKEVEAVYIATTHNSHKELTIKCLKQGKAVLSEKPIAVNQKEMLEMIKHAKEQNVFLMEALWTRFLPVTEMIKSWIDNGRIGEIRHISANFGFRGNNDPNARLLNPKLAGGALLDIGIYPIFFFTFLYDEAPAEIKSIVKFSETGVDVDSNIIMKYSDNKMANMAISFNTYIPRDGLITGTKGVIRIPQFTRSTSATLEIDGEIVEEVNIPFIKNGFEYEIAEVMKCLREGKIESELMSLEESLRLVRIMDAIRESWNFKYPNE